MKLDIDLDQVIYGVLLVGLGLLAHGLAPELGWATLVTGSVGGVLIGLDGVLGLRGLRTPQRRVCPVILLAIVSITLMVEAVLAWQAVRAGTDAARPVAVILTVLLVFGLGQLLNRVKANRSCE